MRTPDINAQIAEIAADPNAYVAETRRRARASAAPLSSLADPADERFTEEQRAKVAEFDAAAPAPESWDADAAIVRVLAVVDEWEANNRHALGGRLSPTGRAIAQTALDAAARVRAAIADPS